MLRRKPKSGNVTYLEVSELSELFAAVVESAEIWFGCIVNDLVGANVAALCESLSTDFARVWSFTCMASFMGLYTS
jgi:hypothetical protein